MAQYITRIHTSDGDKQIDYNALANLPDLSNLGSGISQISLTTEWIGDESPYTQIVTLDNYVITNNSKIDLQPDARTIMQLIEDGVNAMNVENDDGVVTVYVVGEKPSTEMTIQCTIEEVR